MVCRPDFSCPGERRSISPAMIAALRKVRFIRCDSCKPRLEIIAQHVLVEELRRATAVPAAIISDRSRTAHTDERIFAGDETHGLGADALEPPRQQHAERLVRQPAFEGIADEIMAAAAWEGLDQHLVAAGNGAISSAAH